MYWWNFGKLAEDLREDRVDEKERFKYFLATFIGWNIAVQLLAHSSGPFSIRLQGLVTLAIYVIIVIIGIVCFYRANRSGDNADFTARMMCLALPAGVQWASTVAIWNLTYSVIVSLPAAAVGPLSFAYAISDAAWRCWTGGFCTGIGLYFLMVCFITTHEHIAFSAKVEGTEDSPALKETTWAAEHALFGMISGTVIVAVIALTGVWVPSFDDDPSVWKSLTLLAILLWTALFIFVISRYRRRSIKHA